MFAARTAETKAGGPGTAAGRQAFTNSLIAQFNKLYAKTGSFWSVAPSNPTAAGLFSGTATYDRPGAAYIALWQILGTARFTQVLRPSSASTAAARSPSRSSRPRFSAGCRTRATPAGPS